jgi:hypothetical protein
MDPETPGARPSIVDTRATIRAQLVEARAQFTLARDTFGAANHVDRAFADRGVHLASVPEGVSYVHKCPVGGYPTVHMVMPYDDKPVAVIYVTRYRAPGITNFERGAWEGREVPIADGTLVMVGPSASGFDRIEHEWRDALQGSAQTAAGSP